MIKLTDEQEEDAQKMAATPDLPNFSLPGTGKTHTALRALDLVKPKQSLVLAPRIALEWWREQTEEYLGLEAKVLTGGNSKIGGDVVITTYDIARNAKAKLFEHFTEGAMICDESHYVRNPEARRTQALFGKCADGVGGLVSRFDTVWCMTGTPIENYANDMWTQAGALHPEIWDKYGIQTYDQFCRRFTYKREKQFHPNMRPVWKISGNTNEALLHRIVYKDLGAIRRKTAEGLPRLLMRNLHVPVKLTRDVREAMRGLTPDEIARKIMDKDGVLSEVHRIIGMAKVPEVVTYGGDCVKTSPLLIGCWHRDVMKAYQTEFEKLGHRCAQVHGGTSDNEKVRIREAFNKGELPILIGQMRAMGVSWNIQEACRHVIIAETYPSPSIIEQFYKRVYRFGQKNAVQVDNILSTTPVDDALNGVRLKKGSSDARINKSA